MKNKFITTLLILAFITPCKLYSQQNNRIWYFGDRAGLNFNTGSPTVLTNGQLYMHEGAASITDNSGALLFYSNGVTVYNRNQTVMVNGNNLMAGLSSTQACLITALPGSSTQYYIFTTGDENGADNFGYSIVDMNLDGGNGAITSKNVLVANNVAEKMTSIRNVTNDGIWILVHDSGTNIIKSYLLTASGLSALPVNSALGDSILNKSDYHGQMKISPDGTKLAMACSYTNFIDLFDFNIATGVVTNARKLTIPVVTFSGAYGIEFSPDSHLLYGGTGNGLGVYQWDVTLPDVAAINMSRTQIGAFSGGLAGSMQLAPDGKIYIAEYNVTYLATINQPDLPGTASNFVADAISVSPNKSIFGLPNYVQDVTGILPINLLFFKGKNFQGKNMLYWSTASESNTDYFSLQRSNNQNDFITIAKIKASGNCNHVLNYSSTDNFPPEGISYYRLTQTDLDGKTSNSSNIVALQNNTTKPAFMTISPNPATNFIRLNFVKSIVSFEIEVVNGIGQTFLKAKNVKDIDISEFQKGVYFIRLKSVDFLHTAKFIKG